MLIVNQEKNRLLDARNLNEVFMEEVGCSYDLKITTSILQEPHLLTLRMGRYSSLTKAKKAFENFIEAYDKKERIFYAPADSELSRKNLYTSSGKKIPDDFENF